jgi:hypothetical protein
MTRKELQALEKQKVRDEKKRKREERKVLRGSNFFDLFGEGLKKILFPSKKAAESAVEKKITDPAVKKEAKKYRGMDSISKAIAGFKDLFKPMPKPILTPEKYERPIDNILLREATLIISSVAAVTLNLAFLIHKHTSANSFAFELIMLSALFTALFFLLIRLASFAYTPFNYDKNCKFGYWYSGKFHVCNLESPDAPNFNMRIGDLLQKRFQSFSSGQEFP